MSNVRNHPPNSRIYEGVVYISGALWCSPSRSVMVARLNGCQSSETSGFGALPRGADKYSRRWHGTHGHLEFERSLSPIHALEACMHGCTETLFDQTLPQTRNKCSKSRSRHGRGQLSERSRRCCHVAAWWPPVRPAKHWEAPHYCPFLPPQKSGPVMLLRGARVVE